MFWLYLEGFSRPLVQNQRVWLPFPVARHHVTYVLAYVESCHILSYHINISHDLYWDGGSYFKATLYLSTSPAREWWDDLFIKHLVFEEITWWTTPARSDHFVMWVAMQTSNHHIMCFYTNKMYHYFTWHFMFITLSSYITRFKWLSYRVTWWSTRTMWDSIRSRTNIHT
jgi:hypothetical protein